MTQRIEPPDEYLPVFFRLLSRRLIVVTKNDLASDKSSRRKFAKRFIKTELFQSACDWCNIDPRYMKRLFLERRRRK